MSPYSLQTPKGELLAITCLTLQPHFGCQTIKTTHLNVTLAPEHVITPESVGPYAQHHSSNSQGEKPSFLPRPKLMENPRVALKAWPAAMAA